MCLYATLAYEQPCRDLDLDLERLQRKLQDLLQGKNIFLFWMKCGMMSQISGRCWNLYCFMGQRVLPNWLLLIFQGLQSWLLVKFFFEYVVFYANKSKPTNKFSTTIKKWYFLNQLVEAQTRYCQLWFGIRKIIACRWEQVWH